MYRILLVCLLVAVAGCAFQPKDRVTDIAVDYNLAVERAQNEMIFLNIVRASQRRPMHFTAISTLRGNILSTISTGPISIPFGPDSKSAYSIAPTVSYQANPTFDVGVLDTRTFTRGILSPVPVETIKYYWDQGWPKPFLLSLLIRTIETKEKIGTVEYFRKVDNYPGSAKGLKDYFNALEQYFPCAFRGNDTTGTGIPCRLKIVGDISAETVGPATGSEYKKDVTKIVAMLQAGLALVQRKEDNWDLVRRSVRLQVEQAPSMCLRGTMIGPNSSLIPIPQAENCDVTLHIRSPEAIIYYLGEILRTEIESGGDEALRLLSVCEEGVGNLHPIFFGKTSREIENPILSVVYEGTRYVIPQYVSLNQRNTCSMHSISLVSQLVNQQKESADLPFTGAVNIVGGAARP